MGYDASIPGGGSMFPVLGGPADLTNSQADALHKAIKPPSTPPTPLAEIPGSSLAPRPASLSNLEKNRFSPELVSRHIALGGEFEKFAAAAEKQANDLNTGDVTGLAELEHSYAQALEVHKKFPSLGDQSARVAREERLDKIYTSFSALRSKEENRFSSDKVQKHIDLNNQFEAVLSSAEQKLAELGDQPTTAQLAELIQAHRQGLELHRQFPSLGDREAQLQRMERLDFISGAISGIDAPQMVAIESHLAGQKPKSAEEFSDLTRFAMADDAVPQAQTPIKETAVKASPLKAEPAIASTKPSKTSTLAQVSQQNKESIKKEWESIQSKVAKYRTLDPESAKALKLKLEIKADYTQLKLFDDVYKPGTVSLVLKSLGFHEKQVLASLDLNDRVNGTEVAGLSEEVKQKINQHKDKSI